MPLRRRLTIGLAGSAFLAACARSIPAADGGAALLDGAHDAEGLGPRAAMDAAGEQTEPSRLGVLAEACGARRDAGPFMHEEVCADGRIVGFYVPVDTLVSVAPPLDGAREIVARSSGSRGASVGVRVLGTLIEARVVTCGTCRRVMGWGFIGDLRRMADDDLRVIACRLTGRVGADLRTADGWAALAAADAGARSAECAQVRQPFL